MRPIVSNINTPCYKIAKWLVREVKQLPPINSKSVKNSVDFTEKIRDIKVCDDECMVSFDVTSLFPSIPVNIALDQLEKYLDNTVVSIEKKQLYVRVARLCMKHSFFEFREKTYIVEKGTNMGNPLSPLISELFMSHFEMNLHESGLLLRIWLQYVDDVTAIVKRNDIENVLSVLNSRYDSELQKQFDGTIEASIYRKPTNTFRTITSDSHCSLQNKHVAFHAMVHRLNRKKLNNMNYRQEYLTIKKIARINGYDDALIDTLIVHFIHTKSHVKRRKYSCRFIICSRNYE